MPVVGARTRQWRRANFAIGAVLVAAVIGLALLSFVWTPHPATELDIPHKLQPPSWSHWLGTDSLGRDIVSLLIVGSRVSIAVGLIAVGIGIAFGVALGLLAAVKRGWIEEAVMRLADFTFAFPALLSAIMLTAIYGPGLVTSIVAIGIFNVPVFARITRASALVVRSREFVTAARALGKGEWRITFEHVLPNIAAILIVQATIQFATRHPRRGGAQLPRPRHAAADAVVGPHAERGAAAALPGAAARDLPGPGDCPDRAGPEPDGRRPARHLRSAAVAPPHRTVSGCISVVPAGGAARSSCCLPAAA